VPWRRRRVRGHLRGGRRRLLRGDRRAGGVLPLREQLLGGGGVGRRRRRGACRERRRRHRRARGCLPARAAHPDHVALLVYPHLLPRRRPGLQGCVPGNGKTDRSHRADSASPTDGTAACTRSAARLVLRRFGES
jgi:hypothetical protein